MNFNKNCLTANEIFQMKYIRMRDDTEVVPYVEILNLL